MRRGFLPFSFALAAIFGASAVSRAGVVIPFVRNDGQYDSRVAFVAHTRSGAVFVTTKGEIVSVLPDRCPVPPPNALRDGKAKAVGPAAAAVLTERFEGGLARPEAGEPVDTRLSYFVGNEPAKWRSSVSTFRDVDLGEVYPGIDVRLVACDSGVEKVISVSPGASPEQITVSVTGADRLVRNPDGELRAETKKGPISFSAPIGMQLDGGGARAVATSYANSETSYSFVTGAYDCDRELVIDPILQSTYIGGSGDDQIGALTLAPNGDVIVGGTTNSSDFPFTTGSPPSNSSFGSDGFVARLSADLRTTIEAVIVGGGGGDEIFALAVAADGSIVAGGYSDSPDFPKAGGGAQSSPQDGDGIVTQLSSDLRTIIQSTYIGGGGFDQVSAVAISANGEVVVAGDSGGELPHTAGGAQESADSGAAFVARLRGDLKSYVQATYLGGLDDTASAVTIASNGEILVAGETGLSDFPGTAGGAQPSLAGGNDAYVARLTGNLKSFVQSTYLGGGSEDEAKALAIAGNGDILVAGRTASNDFPGTVGGARPAHALFDDVFVARLTGDLKTLTQATYLGGEGEDGAFGIAIAPNSDVVVAGTSASPNFPGTAGGAQEISSERGEAFVARLAANLKTIVQATFFGSTGSEGASGLALAKNGDIVIAGTTSSADLPFTIGGAQAVFGGGEEEGDGFVARLTGDLRRPGREQAGISGIAAGAVRHLSGRGSP